MFSYLTRPFISTETYAINHLNSRLLSLFKEDPVKVTQFKQMLESSDAFISGSILVQCILNENWENSDLDIFIPIQYLEIGSTNYSSPVDKWLKQNYDGVRMIPPIRSSQYVTPRQTYNKHNIKHNIKQLVEFTKKDALKIQLIYFEVSDQTEKTPDNLAAEYIKVFDFGLVQNSFTVRNSVECLKISHLSEITSRTLVYCPYENPNMMAVKYRMEKYISRGFKVDQKTLDLFDKVSLEHSAFYHTQVKIDQLNVQEVTLRKVKLIGAFDSLNTNTYDLIYKGKPLYLTFENVERLGFKSNPVQLSLKCRLPEASLTVLDSLEQHIINLVSKQPKHFGITISGESKTVAKRLSEESSKFVKYFKETVPVCFLKIDGKESDHPDDGTGMITMQPRVWASHSVLYFSCKIRGKPLSYPTIHIASATATSVLLEKYC